MRAFFLGFLFHMVAGINPCADNNMFSGAVEIADAGGATCTAMAGTIQDFTPSEATCMENIAFAGETFTRAKSTSLAAGFCCQSTSSVCKQFEFHVCNDGNSFNKLTVVADKKCGDQMEFIEYFTPDATTCAQTVEWRGRNMSRMTALSTLSACCGGAPFKCSSHVINPCMDPSHFQASSSSCLVAVADLAPFTASAFTCSETIERTSGESQQRKFALHELKNDCCGGQEVLCQLSASEAALSITRWTKAGDSACFAKSNKSLSATAVGACSGSPMTTSYFEQEMNGFKIISGADGAYLTNSSRISDIEIVKFALDTNLNNRCCAPAICGNACLGKATTLEGSYALVQTGMNYGDVPSGRPGGYAGIGYYAIKSGSIQTNLNDFLIDRGDDGFRMSRFACLKYDSAASAAAGNTGVFSMHNDLISSPSPTNGAMPAVCGAATRYVAGQIKFSIYLEFGGRGFGALLTQLGATYLAFRSKFTTTNMSSVFFNNNSSLTHDSLGSQAVASVTFVSSEAAAHQMTVAFEDKYISGRIIDVTGNPTPTKPLSEATVKIKSAKIDSTSFYVDYLFEVTESMRAIDDTLHSGSSNGGQYIVYDPSISVGGDGATTTTVPGGAPTTVASIVNGSTTAVPEAASGAKLCKVPFGIGFLLGLFLSYCSF